MKDEVIIGGGDARNPSLMQKLRDLPAPIPVTDANHASVLESVTPAKNYIFLLKSTIQDFSHAY